MKTYMIISIDRESTFDKILHSFTVKTLSKVERAELFLKLIRVSTGNLQLTLCLKAKD